MKLEELFEGAVVAQLELPEPITVKAGSKLSDAVEAMREGKRGAVIVTNADGKGVAGILTEVDYVKKILGKGHGGDAKVDEVMTAKPETVSPETKLSQAFELMSRGNFRHLPVVSNGGTCGGVLAVRDINLFLAERFPQDVLALPPDVHQILAVDGGQAETMPETKSKPIHEVEKIVIRFAGDSGDGMQLTGSQFTSTSALVGNDIATFPDYPSEIRAPAGTLPGVSGFQVHIGRADIRTPGDKPDVLVAMNPAALKVCLPDMEDGTTIIVNTDEFTDANLKKATWESNPLEDGSLGNIRVIKTPLTKLTLNALEDLDMPHAGKARCKNLFALGMCYWLFDRPIEPTLKWLEAKFKKKPILVEANHKALKTGHFYADTVEMFTTVYRVLPAEHMEPGEYRQITGNEATAMGLTAASVKAGVPLFYGSYPITPASDVLHNLAQYKHYGVMTFQAEDEIAGCGVAVGAAFAGVISVTGTSGPGICLKGEMIGLAVMAELPLVIVNVQRGGPSTGLPTKTEQSDLLQAFFGRNGESPAIIVSPATPTECFDMAYEAVRLATKFMTPVFFMSDGYLANGAEPWMLPDENKLPPIEVKFRTDPNGYQAYSRDENLARPWVKLGTPGLEHRLGGLEKAEGTGNVNMQPLNHQKMCDMRAAKVAKVADDIPPLEVEGPEKGDLLVLGWGGTYGAIHMAVVEWNKNNPDKQIAAAHVRYLNPFPKNTEQVLRRYKKVLIPELNGGQLSLLIRGKYALDAKEMHKLQGRPFMVAELLERFAAELNGGAK